MNRSDTNILVIDDEILICEVLQTGLRYEGLKVRSFQQAKKGLIEFNNNHYDFVISDIQMPEMNGLELLKAIKEIDDHIPVLLISAFSEHSIDKARNMGALDILSKPIDIDQVAELIIKTLRILD